MSLLEALFVNPGCVDDVYEAEDMNTWIQCSTQRARLGSALGAVFIVIVVVLIVVFSGSTTVKVIAAVIGAVLFVGTVIYAIYGVELAARSEFISSRKELLSAGYDPAANFASPAEKLSIRAAAVDRLRRERLEEQKIARMGQSGSPAGNMLASGIGAAIGASIGKRL